MSDAPRQPPPKREVALALLEESSMFIHLDPRRPNVLVPKGFLGQHQLVLQVGLNMAIPIPDLTIDDNGVSCTLSFNRSPFWCRIPWTAIYALVGEDGRGGVWPEDVPPEIQQQKQAGAAPKGPAGKRPRPRLVAQDGEPGRGSGGLDGEPGRGSPNPSGALDGEPGVGSPNPSGALDGAAAEVAREEAPASERTPEPPRVGLMAVPRESQARVAAEPEAQASEASAPAPTPAPGGGGKKPKREIPPYLRVIK